MKKVLPVIITVALCVSLVFIFPQAGMSYQNVDDTGCLICHDVGSPGVAGDDIHGHHPTANCAQCHVVPGDTPASSACIECHPFGDPGKCPLVNFHDPDMGASCLDCHGDECGEPITTTTTTAAATTTTTSVSSTTTTSGFCPSVELYGEGSEEVEILRSIRDNVLSATPEGREIIRLYYQWAPVITIAIQNDEEVRAEVKRLVDGILMSVTE